jgi:SAM-dependent methyltransferase
MKNYFDGLNTKLLEAIPPGARRVLELGCANGRLGRRFKALHPGVQWWGIDASEQAVETASRHLDRVLRMDLDRDDLGTLEGGFDVVVIGDLLEHLLDPARTLDALHGLATPDARIVCCLPNMSHLSVIERLVAGDITYDDAGLLDRGHARFYSASSAFKTFLDAGWLPHLHDSYRVESPPSAFASHIVQAAGALGVPAATAARNLGLYQMILVCSRWSMHHMLTPGPLAPFSVVVPVTRAWQHELNVARSPGLREVDAEVICVQGADSAAAAWDAGAKQARHPWRLVVHQDVYFPQGSGFSIARQLGELERQGLAGAPVGFAGLRPAAHGAAGGVAYAGMVIDRTTLFSHGGSRGAVSMDEFAVAMHAECVVAPDPSLGWHLWATDLCLQGLLGAGQPIAQILEVPLFHNSTNDYVLPDAFHRSARTLLEKYPQLPGIPTLCGELRRPESVPA